MGCLRAPTVYNCCFSICWACLSFPFSFINNNERASQNLSTKLSVKYPFSPSLSASASSWPRYAMQLQQNLPHPSPSSLCPYPSPAQVKREVFLEGRYVITHYFIRRILLSRDSQCAQWNDSWDVCGYYRLIPDNMLHFPWGISSNMHFSLSPFANIWSITEEGNWNGFGLVTDSELFSYKFKQLFAFLFLFLFSSFLIWLLISLMLKLFGKNY